VIQLCISDAERGESSQVAGTTFYRILIYGFNFVCFYLNLVSV
jgi:hypothetical protein